jgi:hypothetical protein
MKKLWKKLVKGNDRLPAPLPEEEGKYYIGNGEWILKKEPTKKDNVGDNYFDQLYAVGSLIFQTNPDYDPNITIGDNTIWKLIGTTESGFTDSNYFFFNNSSYDKNTSSGADTIQLLQINMPKHDHKVTVNSVDKVRFSGGNHDHNGYYNKDVTPGPTTECSHNSDVNRAIRSGDYITLMNDQWDSQWWAYQDSYNNYGHNDSGHSHSYTHKHTAICEGAGTNVIGTLDVINPHVLVYAWLRIE